MNKYKNGLLPKSFDNMFENFESIHNYDVHDIRRITGHKNHKIKTILCSVQSPGGGGTQLFFR